jgi:phenylacetate-CoA ligase
MDRCFVAGLAYQMGLRQLGAAVIRSGANTLTSQCDLIRQLSPTVLVGVPTFLRKLGRFLGENGLDPAATSVRSLVGIGEPLRDADLSPLPLAVDLENLWGAPAYSTYASSEAVTTFCECTSRRGGHLNPELAIVEIVDAAGRRLPGGEHGEVVLTPLQCEGMPLVRFRTGDTSFLIEEPCSCGRITPRLGPILGRQSQMIKTKGTTVYPLSVLAALDSMPGISEYCVVVTSEDRLSDHLTVHAAVSPGHGCSAESIAEHLQSRLRVKTSVVIKTEAEIAREVFAPESRKANRFLDRRSHP